jgi:hypothetical protein
VVIVFENLCFVFKDVLGSLKLYRVECGKEWVGKDVEGNSRDLI